MDPGKAKQVASKIRHYLITTMGKSEKSATDEEFYRAFCFALREEIMINWTATHETWLQTKPRMAYYLSMEYMPGRLLQNNINNLGATALVSEVFKIMHRDMNKIFFIESDIGIGNGGLGRLASCLLDSLATLKYPAMGYGLRYQYGIFEQEVWCGVQLERPDCWLLTENPWEFRREASANVISFGGRVIERKNSAGEAVFETIDADDVRALPFDFPIIGYCPHPNFPVLTLRLWSTKESPRNFQLQRYNAGELGQAAENTSLTDVLYPNDNHEVGKRIRLKQEFLLVSASVQDIIQRHITTNGAIKDFSDKVRIQINDTHPALAIVELHRLLMKDHGFTWDRAWEIVTASCSYTNHTVLKEALEEWNAHRLQELLPRQYIALEQLHLKLLGEVKQRFPNDQARLDRMGILQGGQAKMAHLAIYGSHKVNGVAKIHSAILKASLFKDFAEMFPEKFTNVTNGVTQRRWLLTANPKLAAIITDRIGDRWITHFPEISRLAAFADDPDTQKCFLQIKKENKENYIAYLGEKMKHRHWHEQLAVREYLLDTDALFDVHIKRIHEYKRQFMNALHTIMLYQELKANPQARGVKRMIFIGGKAAPGYQIAKDIIRLIYCLSRTINNDHDVKDRLRILFVENYNVSEAEHLIPAADLSQQISTAGMEASGTGNMKLTINGALTIGTRDGASIEMEEHVGTQWWPFAFGNSSENNALASRDGSYHPQKIVDDYPVIGKAVHTLIDGSFTETEMEEEACRRLHSTLFPTTGERGDKYFVLNDLPLYYDAHKNVEALYQDPTAWVRHVIHNIAGMGPFSSDIAIHNYAQNIWSIQPTAIEATIINNIRKEYSELDRCRIL